MLVVALAGGAPMEVVGYCGFFAALSAYLVGARWAVRYLIDGRRSKAKPLTSEERLLARIRDDYGTDKISEEEMEAEIAAVIRGETPKRLEPAAKYDALREIKAGPSRSSRALTLDQQRRLARARAHGRPRPLRIDGHYGPGTRYSAQEVKRLLGYVRDGLMDKQDVVRLLRENAGTSRHHIGGGMDISASTITAADIHTEHIEAERLESPFQPPKLDFDRR